MIDVDCILWRNRVEPRVYQRLSIGLKLDLFEVSKVFTIASLKERGSYLTVPTEASLNFNQGLLSIICHILPLPHNSLTAGTVFWIDAAVSKIVELAKQDIQLDELQAMFDLLGSDGVHQQIFPDEYPEWKLPIGW